MGINKYNRDNIIAEVKFVSMLPGDINKSLGILKFEELKIDSVSKNLKNLEADLKVKIKEAILWEMAFTKDVPDTITINIIFDGEIIKPISIPFKKEYNLCLSDTEDDIIMVMEGIEEISKLVPEEVSKILPYHILHNEKFILANK